MHPWKIQVQVDKKIYDNVMMIHRHLHKNKILNNLYDHDRFHYDQFDDEHIYVQHYKFDARRVVVEKLQQ
jgi:hypothetical protein